MRGELIKPGWLLLIILALWGIAGKLDEPLDESDPEPMASAIMDSAEEASFPPIHLLCYLDERARGHDSSVPGAASLTSFQPSQQPSRGGVIGNGRQLPCVVADDWETPMKVQTRSIRDLPMQRLLPVRSVDELALLVKESEILTCNAGRAFVVAGADRPAYLVRADIAGFAIAHLDSPVQHQMLATGQELASHAIGNAMACGLLYTEPLSQ